MTRRAETRSLLQDTAQLQQCQKRRYHSMPRNLSRSLQDVSYDETAVIPDISDAAIPQLYRSKLRVATLIPIPFYTIRYDAIHNRKFDEGYHRK